MVEKSLNTQQPCAYVKTADQVSDSFVKAFTFWLN